jgi:BirA family biotin operon repressor/biotin-[acetyl-CoA-carboxylase] ligase
MVSHIPPDNGLHIESIAALLSPETRRRYDLRVVETTASTNSDLLRDAAQLPSGSVLAARHQTAGRGRRGRNWIAPPEGSLAFSVLWKFRGSAAMLSGLSLAVGVAVARALDECGARDIALKWPNDLLVPHGTGWAKLGGILIELAGEPADTVSTVIGIGLNLDLGTAAGDIDQPVADLAGAGCKASRNALLAAVLRQLGVVLPAFATDGFAPFADEWNRRHAWHGLPVQLASEAADVRNRPGGAVAPVSGVTCGVAADGALLLETPDGIHRIVSGDVSLRLAAVNRP